MNEIQIYDKNDIYVQDIKFDKAIQNFLERNEFEYYDVLELKEENDYDIDFIKINHISYDRSKDETNLNLIDFEQILSAISSKNGKIVYVIESSSNGIDLFLGTKKDSKEFLNSSFQGVYSGSLTSKEDKPKFNSSKNFSKAMLGIPSLKRDSDKKYNQSLEKKYFFLCKEKIFV